jgi:hypothetical protein
MVLLPGSVSPDVAACLSFLDAPGVATRLARADFFFTNTPLEGVLLRSGAADRRPSTEF